MFTEADIVKWVVWGAVGIVMWFLRNTITKSQKDIEDLKADNIKIRTDYLHRDDFREFKVELRLMFDELKQSIKEIHK